MKCLVLVLSLLLLGNLANASVPDDLQRVSVTIKAEGAQGSGTLVTRKVGNDTVSFVWTAAHVVDGLRTTRSVIVNGSSRTLIEYKDAEIVQEQQQGGRRVGEVKFDCRVIKVSDADYGEDLALLMVRSKGAYPLTACAKFHKDSNYIPPIGVALSHCGSLLGQFGANSYTTGVLSQTGRTLAMKGANVKTFDQVTAVAFPGSSGGGMFLTENGEYVGMLTQGVMKLQGFNFIVPVRRMYVFAKAAKIEWAINPNVPMPTMQQIEAIPVEDSGPATERHQERPGTPEAGAPCLKPLFNDAPQWVTQFIGLFGSRS